MTRSRSLVLLALTVFIVANCKKEDGAKKTAEKDVPQKTEDSKDSKDVDKKPTPSDALAEPGLVTIDQAIASMGTNAAHRLVVRAPALVSSGLVEIGLGAMPAEARSKYDEFVTSSGFDPVKVVTGALVYANGELSDFETAKPTMIFGLRGSSFDKLVEKLSNDDDDDDDDDDDKEPTEFSAVFLAKLDAPTQDRIRSELLKDKKKDVSALHEQIGTAHVVAKIDAKSFKYGYIWSGGMVLSEVPIGLVKAANLDAAKSLLKPILAELAKASSASGTSGPAIEGRGAADGTSAKFSVAINKNFVIDATVKPPANKLAEAKPILGIIKQQPEAFAAQMPPQGRELAKLFMSGTKMDIVKDSVVVHSEVDLERLKALAKPLLDQVSK